MKIYLASRYGRHEEMENVAIKLKCLGFEITSRWHNGSHQANDDELEKHVDKAVEFALDDVSDLKVANVVVCFTEVPRTINSRGGRHVELGMPIAWNKKIIVVGHRENIFCCLPNIEFCKDVNELYKKLKKKELPDFDDIYCNTICSFVSVILKKGSYCKKYKKKLGGIMVERCEKCIKEFGKEEK